MTGTRGSAGAGPSRFLLAQAHAMELDGVGGRVLFPTLQQGPWLPWERFAESTVDHAEAPSEPHEHASEEVLLYVLSGDVADVEKGGRTARVGGGSAMLLTSGPTSSHDVYATGTGARWISVVQRLPAALAGASRSVQRTAAPTPEPRAPGVRYGRLVGPGGPLRSAGGWVVDEVELVAGASHDIDLATPGRSIVYVLDGNGRLDGRAVSPGAGALTENRPRLPLQAAERFRLLLLTVAPGGADGPG